MHEPRLLGPVIKGIAEHAKKEGAKTVKTVRLKIGQRLKLQEVLVREAFISLTKGTILEGAKLELIYFPAYRIEVVSFDIE
jgi:Zn finger protein HypA/HybF involved in hydrogenase expression